MPWASQSRWEKVTAHSPEIGWEVYPVGLMTSSSAFEGYKLPLEIPKRLLLGDAPTPTASRRHPCSILSRNIRELARPYRRWQTCAATMPGPLSDNFEWAEGYTQRFWLVLHRLPTQRATLKDSAKWFSKIALDHNRMTTGQRVAAHWGTAGVRPSNRVSQRPRPDQDKGHFRQTQSFNLD